MLEPFFQVHSGGTGIELAISVQGNDVFYASEL